jgi:signal transduction histidine kinase
MTRRLLGSYLLITALALVLFGVPLGAFFAQRERERVTSGLEHDATVIATIYEDDLENGQPLDPAAAVEYSHRTGARVVIVDAEGTSVVDTAAPIDRDFSTRPEISTALGGRVATGDRSSDTLATDIIYVAIPVASDGTVHGAIRLTLDTSDVTARIRRFWLGLAAIAAVILAVVALVGWFLARSISRPLRQLEADADRYASGDLTVDERPPSGPPEVRALTTSVTTMAERLDALLAAQRAFVADASHQLRSPLTALNLRLENLQNQLPADAQEQIEAAITETKRLAGIVNDLLQLARADDRRPLVIVDLAGLSRDRVDTWSAAAEAADVSIRASNLEHRIDVEVLPGAVEQILDNLLDNAVNASPAGATIDVGISATAAQAELTVTDEGAGLDDVDKVQATHRFWRGTTSGEGTGLGLAIVDALVRASHAELRLADGPGGGLRVIVSFRRPDRSTSAGAQQPDRDVSSLTDQNG